MIAMMEGNGNKNKKKGGKLEDNGKENRGKSKKITKEELKRERGN
jgi:hypothetical protein